MAEATCPVCDNPLPATPHGGSPRRYCSRACRYLAKNRARRSSTTAPRCSAHPDCISPAFARGWCNAHYWQWFVRGDLNNADEPTPALDPSKPRWPRQNERRFLRIMNRDQWRCRLCGTRIKQDVRFPDQDAGTLDHILPRSLGGPDDDANLQAAHLLCNQRKSNRVHGNGEQLRLIG